jgi:ATP-dependent exoDNAse (exonuclease V) alpha subunit
MPITPFLPFSPTACQAMAIRKLAEFFKNKDRIFILQGYAGTGKTTLLKGVLDYLDSIERPYQTMASTGRAARVMSLKTGRLATTIHSTVYVLDRDKSIVSEEKKTLTFKLRRNSDNEDTIYFIDEASMIADKNEVNPNLQFDDGKFLSHIFTYTGNRKIVFIGDNAQLPPVNCSFSAALSPDYISTNYRLPVMHVALTEVKRQAISSGIIDNATDMREKLFAVSLPPLSLNARNRNDISIPRNIWIAIDGFVKQVRREGVENSIFIAFSNGSVHYLNNQIRKGLYCEEDPPLQIGEWLMVNQNNTPTGLSNGQHVKLVSFNDRGEHVGEVYLLDAVVQDPESHDKYNVKLVKNTLFSSATGLTVQQEKELTKDFAIRMHYQNIKPKTEEYVNHMMTDPRFNPLILKFGYAVTCHKAQGGEWNQVFINLEPAFTNIDRAGQYRWLYTAITRAAKNLIIPQNPIIY